MTIRRVPGPIVAACTVAVGTLVALVLWNLAGSDSARMLWLDAVTAVLSVGLVPMTLRWPIVGGLAAGLLAVLSPVATPVATVAALNAARLRRFRPAHGEGRRWVSSLRYAPHQRPWLPELLVRVFTGHAALRSR